MEETNMTNVNENVEASTEAVEEKEIDWKAEARKWEARSKENLESARSNEEAARRLTEIEDANKTELEKAIARADAAEQKLTATAFEAMKARVVAKFDLEEEDVELFLNGADEESLTKQAERLASKKAVEAPAPTRIGFGLDLSERPDSLDNSSDDDLARQIFGV